MLHVRAQNAAIIVRKDEQRMLFEIFEVSPSNEAVYGTAGKLIRTFPGAAVEIPINIANDRVFLNELSSFVCQMDVDQLDSSAKTFKADSTVVEARDTVDPKYISQLLVGILRGIGKQAEGVRYIKKRTAEEVLWKDALKPWRRSPLWLIIRVALQTTLDEREYKFFLIYLMSKLLRRSLEYDLESDLIFAMRAKLSQRFWKASTAYLAPPESLAQEVTRVVEDVEVVLQRRWRILQERQACAPPWRPMELDFEADQAISLKNSSDYLKNVQEKSFQSESTEYQPPSRPRLGCISDFSRFLNDDYLNGYAPNRDNQRTVLFDIEQSVERNLDRWLSDNLSRGTTGEVLAAVMEQYHGLANKAYHGNPEDMSIMVLTVMHIWVCIDKFAVHHLPLLSKYSPEIPPGFLDGLLLRRRADLDRALNIERHLRERNAHIRTPSILGEGPNANSFSVVYFNDNAGLKHVKHQIEERAERERQEKRNELGRLNARYSELVRQLLSTTHDQYWDTIWEKSRCCKGCPRCRLQGEISSMTISVNEWPLPSDNIAAQSVIFELQPPVEFSIWRDITYKVIHDVVPSTKCPSFGSQHMLLPAYRALHNWYHWRDSDTRPRLTLASTKKSFTQAHYSRQPIPATESSICVNNELSFALYDETNSSWAGAILSPSSRAAYYFQFPDGSPYRNLHCYLPATEHSANDVIANQVDCPQTLSLHEFYAFGTVRSGGHLQWLNMLRELASSHLSFHHEEVHALLMQAAWEVGPAAEDTRSWQYHSILKDENFATALIEQLGICIQAVAENWREVVFVKTIVLLSSRILSCAQPQNTSLRSDIYSLLRNIRKP
ncbi:hypothetical protein K474DRAFT_1668514 [Panus rudis PR-1116 ss-1]|nr:hypothetical protein K474DRAFT_1668514 [Panus rudis PR-1116 ss-1]